MNTAPENAHRLLAPRVAYLIGTRAADGTPNLIPVSNLTSISTDPQQIALAVYKQWKTHHNLITADGFTLSVPNIDQLAGVWKLGAKYSHYPYTDNEEKISASGLAIDYEICSYGPILTDGIGWLTCRKLQNIDFGGNHTLFIGHINQAHFNPHYLNPEGIPHTDTHPLMQVTGNTFTTSTRPQTIPYHN
ncbi:MAG: flavin reductase family protein [Pseudonocardiaceae bacterium]